MTLIERLQEKTGSRMVAEARCNEAANVIKQQAARIAELEAELQIAKHNEKCTHDANVNLCKELAALHRKIDEAPEMAAAEEFKNYLKSIGYTDPRRI